MTAEERRTRRALRDELYRAAAAGELDEWRPDDLDRAGLDLAEIAAIRAGADGIAWQNDLSDEPRRWWREDLEPPPGWVRGDAVDPPRRRPIVTADGREMYASRCGDLTGINPPAVMFDEDPDPDDQWW
jgi:hypothetical protein